MYSIVNSISGRCLPTEANSSKPCKVVKVALAIILTLGVGVAAFSALFFTAHLLVPALATSISLVVLLGGVDVCIAVCCKKRVVPFQINLLGEPPNNHDGLPVIEINEELVIDSPDQVAKEMGYVFLNAPNISQNRQLHILDSTKTLKTIPLSDDELLVNLQFLWNSENQDQLDVHVKNVMGTIFFIDHEQICDNYYLTKIDDSIIVVKNLKQPDFNLKIQGESNTFIPILYYIINDYLFLYSYSASKKKILCRSLEIIR